MKKILFLILFLFNFLPLFLFSDTSIFCSNGSYTGYYSKPTTFSCPNGFYYYTDNVNVYHDVNHLDKSYPSTLSVSLLSDDRISLTFGHSEGNDFIRDTYIYYPRTCPPDQHLGTDGECHPNCSLNPPSIWNNLPYYSHFDDMQPALDFIHTHNIQNAYIISINDLPSNSVSGDCKGYILYTDFNSSSNPCNNFIPPIMYGEYPLQGTFKTFSNCTNFLSFQGLDGVCKSFNDCPTIYAYYKIDGNVTYPPPFDENGTLTLPQFDYNSTNNNDNNYSAPANTDDNNDSIDMSPVLNQLSDLSQLQHNDLKNLANKADVTNNKLNSISSKIDTTNINLNSISSKIDTTNTNLNSINDKLSDLNGDNFLDNLSFTQMTDFYNNIQADFNSIDTQYNDFKNAINGNFDGYSLSSGSSPVFTANVFGKTLTLNLCSTFSVFRPFVSFIFSAIFLFLAIKIFWLGVKL